MSPRFHPSTTLNKKLRVHIQTVHSDDKSSVALIRLSLLIVARDSVLLKDHHLLVSSFSVFSIRLPLAIRAIGIFPFRCFASDEFFVYPCDYLFVFTDVNIRYCCTYSIYYAIYFYFIFFAIKK